MFQRRRRPILGAAIVYGASRSAARREVQLQSRADAQREDEIQRAVERRRREDEEQELRTQRAVEEAMKKSTQENQVAQQSAPAVLSPPPPQYYGTLPPMPVQTQETGFYGPIADVGPSSQRAPVYSLEPPFQERRPKSAQEIRSRGVVSASGTQYCTQCGFGCTAEDRFCRQCGAKQVD